MEKKIVIGNNYFYYNKIKLEYRNRLFFMYYSIQF